MTTYRVASNANVGLINWDLARSSQRLTRLQDQIASQKRIQRPSDDPGGTADALASRAQIRRTEQQTANADDANGWLRQADSALMSFQTQLSVVRERGVQAINGAMDSVAREGIAREIEGMRDSLLQLANTTYQNRSVFAGTVAAGTAAYDSSGVYTGDNGAVRRTVADGTTLQINNNGPAVFGTNNATTPMSGDIFQVLSAMATAVRNNDVTTVSSSLTAIDDGAKRIAVVQTTVGAMSQQIDSIINRNDETLLDTKDRLSTIEDVDMAQAIIDFRVQESAYQAALSVTAKVIQPSLVDFLH